MPIRKANVKIEDNKVIFSQEIINYFESLRNEGTSEWIDKYFDILSDPSNFNAEKYNIHHIIPCCTFKDKNHKTRKETEPLANKFNGNLIKLSVYNHIFAHYYLRKIFNDVNSKMAFQRMCSIRKFAENITENELKEIAILKEECAKENLTEEEIIELKRKYAKTHKEKIKQYYESHKQEKAEYDKKYRETNKDIISKRRKQYREKNKDNIKKSSHEWYENNKEEHSKKAKIYRKENKEKLAKHSKEYREQNKEKLKIIKKTYASQECYDPIKENYCTLNALSLRKSRHLDLYKNIIPQNCIIQK